MPTTKERLSATARYIASLVSASQYGKDAPPLPEGVTYEGVYVLSKSHSLAGAIWYLLEERSEEIGEELSLKWTRERDIAFLQNAHQYREFSRITAKFSECEIPFLPMKGFIFKELWHRPEMRTMSDIDICVSPSDIERASDVLLSLGYSAEDECEVHSSFVKPPYINIELHNTVERGREVSFDDWKCRDDNPMWYTMSNEECFVFHLSHMYKHYVTGGSGMRSFFDLLLFEQGREMDRTLLEKLLAERELSDFYKLARRLSLLWYSDEKIEEDEEILEFEQYIITGGAYGTVENRVSRAVKKQNRIAYFFSRAFLPYSKMIYVYRWLPKCPILLPVAWVMRWFAALFDGRMKREVKAMKK